VSREVFMGNKRCGCGKEHSLEAWARLRLLGPQIFEHGEAFELRNCPCDSTMAWPIDWLAARRGEVVYLAVDFQLSEAA
jgi:hypothetical protein